LGGKGKRGGRINLKRLKTGRGVQSFGRKESHKAGGLEGGGEDFGKKERGAVPSGVFKKVWGGEEGRPEMARDKGEGLYQNHPARGVKGRPEKVRITARRTW